MCLIVLFYLFILLFSFFFLNSKPGTWGSPEAGLKDSGLGSALHGAGIRNQITTAAAGIQGLLKKKGHFEIQG